MNTKPSADIDGYGVQVQSPSAKLKLKFKKIPIESS